MSWGGPGGGGNGCAVGATPCAGGSPCTTGPEGSCAVDTWDRSTIERVAAVVPRKHRLFMRARGAILVPRC